MNTEQACRKHIDRHIPPCYGVAVTNSKNTNLTGAQRMNIHHAQRKKAEKIGVALSVVDGLVEAHWAEHNQRVYGSGASEALVQIDALQTAFRSVGAGLRIYHSPRDLRLVQFEHNGSPLNDGFALPSDLVTLVIRRAQLIASMPPTRAPDTEPTAVLKGIPVDGAVAYSLGVMAADCPFDEGTDEAERWYASWDAAADAHPTPPRSGSVVRDVFRSRYIEAGHPNTCNDWLAQVLNNMSGGEQLNIDAFEQLCSLNGVDLSKYNRTTRGWQGRLRMTGRNLLARTVFKSGGTLYTPAGKMQAPADWMSSQRFKHTKV